MCYADRYRIVLIVILNRPFYFHERVEHFRYLVLVRITPAGYGALHLRGRVLKNTDVEFCSHRYKRASHFRDFHRSLVITREVESLKRHGVRFIRFDNLFAFAHYHSEPLGEIRFRMRFNAGGVKRIFIRASLSDSESGRIFLGAYPFWVLSNAQEALPCVASERPCFESKCFISAPVRFRLSVKVSMMIAAPPGPYVSYTMKSNVLASTDVPLAIARSTFSFGMFVCFAFSIAERSAGLLKSPFAFFDSIVMRFASFPKSAPRSASFAPFCLFICVHLLCPDMRAFYTKSYTHLLPQEIHETEHVRGI